MSEKKCANEVLTYLKSNEHISFEVLINITKKYNIVEWSNRLQKLNIYFESFNEFCVIFLNYISQEENILNNSENDFFSKINSYINYWRSYNKISVEGFLKNFKIMPYYDVTSDSSGIGVFEYEGFFGVEKKTCNVFNNKMRIMLKNIGSILIEINEKIPAYAEFEKLKEKLKAEDAKRTQDLWQEHLKREKQLKANYPAAEARERAAEIEKEAQKIKKEKVEAERLLEKEKEEQEIRDHERRKIEAMELYRNEQEAKERDHERRKIEAMELHRNEQEAKEKQLLIIKENVRLSELEMFNKMQNYPLEHHLDAFLQKIDNLTQDELKGNLNSKYLNLYIKMKMSFEKLGLLPPEKLVAVSNDIYRLDQIETIMDTYDQKIRRVKKDQSLEEDEKYEKIEYWKRLRDRDIAELEK